jgi:hypothetical protein
LSCLVLSCLVLSCLVLSCLVLSCLALWFCLVVCSCHPKRCPIETPPQNISIRSNIPSALVPTSKGIELSKSAIKAKVVVCVFVCVYVCVCVCVCCCCRNFVPLCRSYDVCTSAEVTIISLNVSMLSSVETQNIAATLVLTPPVRTDGIYPSVVKLPVFLRPFPPCLFRNL